MAADAAARESRAAVPTRTVRSDAPSALPLGKGAVAPRETVAAVRGVSDRRERRRGLPIVPLEYILVHCKQEQNTTTVAKESTSRVIPTASKDLFG